MVRCTPGLQEGPKLNETSLVMKKTRTPIYLAQPPSINAYNSVPAPPSFLAPKTHRLNHSSLMSSSMAMSSFHQYTLPPKSLPQISSLHASNPFRHQAPLPRAAEIHSKVTKQSEYMHWRTKAACLTASQFMRQC